MLDGKQAGDDRESTTSPSRNAMHRAGLIREPRRHCLGATLFITVLHAPVISRRTSH